MPFEIPTIKALAERTARAFRSNLKGSDAFLWPNNLAVSAKVMAGAVWESFSFLDFLSRQVLAQSAEGPWLERHAAEFGLARLPASYAQGTVTITGDPMVQVPAGILLQRSDGLRYEVTVGGSTGGLGTVTLPVRALDPGKRGNAVPQTALAFVSPMSRLATVATVAAGGIGLGADTESDESLRARVLFRKRMPPHGGAVHDYVAWVRSINGVTAVFVDPVSMTSSRASVGVWFLMHGVYANGIPQAADVAGVAAYIDTVRPAGALVDVQAPVAQTVPITIDNLSPDTAAVREAIAAELADLFRAEVRVSTLAAPYTLYRSLIVEAIARATGEHHHTLVTPATDVTYSVGSIPVLGAISYT